MATKYARATGNWTTDATWSTTSGGPADTTKPTAADDAVLDAASGAINVTINSGAVCRSLDCNGYTGTITPSATLVIGDVTAPTAGRALRLATGMSFTGYQAFNMVSTAAGTHTITTNGKLFGYLNIAGTSTYQLADALTLNDVLTLTSGTLDTNGQSVSASSFASSNSNTRTLTLGSSAITLSSTSAAWSAATVTNLTVTANTATVTLTGSNAVFQSGTFNWNGMSLVQAGAGAVTVAGSGNAFTVANYTRTGTAVKTDWLVVSTPFTCTGTCTFTGNSATNRLLVYSSTLGTARTITAAAVSLTNVDFRDITGAGAATWSGTSIGNALGNTGITFTTPVTVTHNAGAAGNWSTAANWDGGKVPLCHDTVVIPATTTGTLTNDMPRMGADISFANGFAGTFSQGAATDIQGSVVLGSGMTLSGTATITFRGRSSHTVTSAGKTWTPSIAFDNVSGVYTLADAFTSNRSSSGAVHVISGTLADAGFAISLTGVASRFTVGTTGATVTLSGVTTLAGTTDATPWSCATGTVNHTGTIVLSGATATNRTFAGGGKTYGTLTYTVAGSTGALAITGANTFGTINFSDATNARTLTLPAGVTTTITNAFNVFGTAGKLMTVNAA